MSVETALSYGRASRDPKRRGASVDTQLRENERWATTNGVAITHRIRDDDRSASAYRKREREGFEEALNLIRARVVDVVLVWEMSRASRDLEDYVRLRSACHEAGVHLVYKGRRFDLSRSDDRLSTGLDALLAERESNDIRDRNLRTVAANADRRRPHGRVPYGFRREYDPTTGALIRQTPYSASDSTQLLPEATVLADAAHALLQGSTLRAICRELNARGIPTPRKPRRETLQDNSAGVVTRWEPSTLRQLLRNPTIAGRRVHRGEDIGPADWEPIIDYGTWLRLHALFSDPARLSVKVPRGPAPRHLLSGIACCGECGARMKAATNLSRLPRAYVCRNEGCMKVTVTADRVDERIDEVLSALFDRPDFQKALAEAHRRRETSLARQPDVSSLIAERESELEEVESLRASGDLTLRAYAAETKRIEDAIEQLRGQQVAAVSSPALRRLLSASTLHDGWRSASLSDQREVVRLLLTVRINRAVVRGRRFDPGRVEVEPSELLTHEAMGSDGVAAV